MSTITFTQNKKTQAGFTLLELSIVLGISALLLIMLMRMLFVYQAELDNEKSKRSIVNAKTSIARFYELEGRYPCPANTTLMPSNADYGHEDCSLATTPGMRTNMSDVLVGMLPVYADSADGERIDLAGLIEKNEIVNTGLKDAWGNYLGYAVTQSLTRKYDPEEEKLHPHTTFDAYRGSIQVKDEHNRDTGGTLKDAHFFVFSGGKNQLGVKNAAQGTFHPCDTSFTLENENCNGDAVFIAALKSGADKTSSEKARFFDDYAGFATTVPTTLWSKMPVENTATGNVEMAEDSVSTVTKGNVGIGTVTPRAKLEIGAYDSANPAMVAKSTLMADRATIAQEICDADDSTSKCFTPKSLIDLSCAPGYYMKGTRIDASSKKLMPICQMLDIASINKTCDDVGVTNGIIRGIRSNGDIDCVKPEPITLIADWFLIPGDNNSNTAAMNAGCPSGWTATWVTDDTGGGGRSLSEEKKNGKHQQLCLKTSDAQVTVLSQWKFVTTYINGVDTSPACDSGYVDTTIRDDYRASEVHRHSTSEEEDPFRNNMRWCVGITGKNYTIQFKWIVGTRKKNPECRDGVDGTTIISARNNHRNFNSESDSGSYSTLCAKIVPN